MYSIEELREYWDNVMKPEQECDTDQKITKAQPKEATRLQEEETTSHVDLRTVWFYVSCSYVSLACFYLLLSSGSIGIEVYALRLLTDVSASEAIFFLTTENMRANLYTWGSVVLAAALLAIIGRYCGIRFGVVSAINCHQKLLSAISSAPMDSFWDKQPIGRIINRCAIDMGHIDHLLWHAIHHTVITLTKAVGEMSFVYIIMPKVLLLIGLPCFFVLERCVHIWRRTMPSVENIMAKRTSILENCVSEVMRGRMTVRAFGEKQRVAEEHQEAQDRVQVLARAQYLAYMWVLLILTPTCCLNSTIICFVGLTRPLDVRPTLYGLAFVFAMTFEAQLREVVKSSTNLELRFIHVERVREYTLAPAERPRYMPIDSELTKRSALIFGSDLVGLTSCVVNGKTIVQTLNGRIVLEETCDGNSLKLAPGAQLKDLASVPAFENLSHNVILCGVEDTCLPPAMARTLCAKASVGNSQCRLFFRTPFLSDGVRVDVEGLFAGYGGGPDVLRGVSMKIEKGKKVGIVGATGSGKSSLILCMLRLLEPRDGRILLNGVDHRELGLRLLRETLGLVPQDPVLFEGTVRHNIDVLNQYTDQEVINALHSCQLQAFTKRTEGLGLDDYITGDGGNLSLGEKQLFCIARMVARQPALLLLDEATSAVDPRTEEAVQQTIFGAFSNSTIISIAHRLETVLDFDQICVLDCGRVAEFGSTKTLRATEDSKFSKMWKAFQGSS